MNQELSIQSTMQTLREHLKETFNENIVAHDMAHLDRVLDNAFDICVTELGADKFVVGIAALLHDFHRVLERNAGHYVAPEEAEPPLRRMLETLRCVSADDIDRICEAINFTEYYRCAGDDIDALAPTLEARIVRDADMLDALGAVGIARAFMFGGHLGEPMWVETGEDSVGRAFVHGKTSSVVHHFHEKLFRLEAEMLTARGKALARERTVYMKRFVDQLMTELRPSPRR